MNNNNPTRIKIKANRNLYQDQIIFISLLAKEREISDSELLRQIIDKYWLEIKLEKLEEPNV